MTTETSEAIPATVPASDALLTAVMEAIRCTAFIPEPEIRARYVIADLRLRDIIIQEKRDEPLTKSTPSDPRFHLCLCGFPRWRHPATEAVRKAIAWTTSHTQTPHHLFMDSPDVIVTVRGPKGQFQRAVR